MGLNVAHFFDAAAGDLFEVEGGDGAVGPLEAEDAEAVEGLVVAEFGGECAEVFGGDEEERRAVAVGLNGLEGFPGGLFFFAEERG